MSATASLIWAEQQFGRARLGNQARNRRLVRMSAAALRRPGGTVTSVVNTAAEQEAAFRFVRNPKVSAAEIGRSHHIATALRCNDLPYVVVAVDQSTASLTDHARSKGLGPSGGRFSDKTKKRSAEVMSALAVAPNGTPLGLLAQQWWRRSDEHSPDWHDDDRAADERESAWWMRTMQQVLERLEEAGSTTKPWLQCDRGADYWAVFDFAERNDLWLTVRSAHDRCLWNSDLRLHQYMADARCRGSLEVLVPALRQPIKPTRRGRTARLSIRFEAVELEITDDDGHKSVIELNAVYAAERGSRHERIEWLLLTTHPVRTLVDAKQVVLAYAQRWKIEVFHRAWKSGACNIESSQLRSPDAFCRWATILAAVATRIEELKHLARTTPDAPALGQLSRSELDAAIVLSRTRKFKPGDALTMGQAIALIAQIGGYTGKSSGGPPGTITISRGLHDVTVAAQAIDALKT